MIPLRRAAPLLSTVIVAGIALSGCATKEAEKEAASATSSTAASSPTSAAKPAGDKVAPGDLPAIVANRTYRGVDEGKPYAEYYAADGTLRGKAEGKAYTGSWKVVGEELCFTYPKEGADSDTECYGVFKNGDAITWTDSDGKVVETTYVQGNPDKL